MKAKLAADPDFDVMHNPSAPSTWEGRGQKEGGKKRWGGRGCGERDDQTYNGEFDHVVSVCVCVCEHA